MKVLLFGGRGQVGWQLRRSLSLLGEVVVAERQGTPCCGDLLQPAAIRDAILALRPQAVVNAAAYTAVDRAEDEPELAFAINARACEAMAEACTQAGCWLVHYSSDYVYRGDGAGPWRETDPCEPLGVYGKSKLQGDLAVATTPRHLILRTSWVFETWGGNFLKSILKAARDRDELSVVSDQWGAPTRAALIADVTALALRQLRQDPDAMARAGVYHLAGAGETNWHAYACFAIEQAAAAGLPLRARSSQVRAISTADYAARAPRPANSRLDTTRLRSGFGIHLPPWQDGVSAVVAELARQALAAS
ncbi:dTDP-4-dehydrorhamnose reductase [Ramlibacter solisilvae]|uniref:dTDP-4-dehydrorhamnose reductase n=1 Tax=Ramlibacter tataouinensis TaxID=94132 RepID=A0A127JQT4_9BURK|nr:dTDP-4-dehydrorhamnose reductase [Ramlibacter tataouinensis]AMO22263.1 dTDP-4-dehydrorhamnose reductase [Ramlibacter tataouinensis]